MAARLLRGTQGFRKTAQERRSSSSNFLFLSQDGEKAKLRFLTDMDDFVSGVFHRQMMGKKLSDPTPCVEWMIREGFHAGDPTDTCKLCDAKVPSRNQFWAYAYVYYVLHPFQNPRLEQDPDATKWVPMKVAAGAKPLFKQDVGKLRIVLYGEQVFDSLLALFEEYTTLLDRDYTLVRNGAKGDSNTSYTFIAASEAPVAPEIKELLSAEEDLETLALRGVSSAASEPVINYDDEPASTPLDDETADL